MKLSIFYIFLQKAFKRKISSTLFSTHPSPPACCSLPFPSRCPSDLFHTNTRICFTQMLNNLELFLSNAKSERGVFQMFGVQAVPPLPAPHCAKKGPFVELKSGRQMGGFSTKRTSSRRGQFQPWENYHTHQNRTPGANPLPK